MPREETFLGGVDRHTEFDAVDKPEHYNKNGIEAWDAIRAALTKEEWEGYCKGNVIKYVWRWRYKGGLEDLKKSARYHEKLIESVKEVPKHETQACTKP